MAISTTFTLKFAGAAVQRGISRVTASFRALGGVAKSVGKMLLSPFAGIAAAVGGLLAARSLLRTAVELNTIGEAAQTSQARLESIASSMGIFGGDVKKVTSRLSDLANEQGRLLGIDNKMIRLTQSKLMTFRDIAKTADEAGGVFDRVTMAAIGMATAGFGTAETNAVQLGKALQDPARGLTALSRTGALTRDQMDEISEAFKRTGDLGAAQRSILLALEAQVGKTAGATSNASDRMKESWNQLKEAFGKPFSIQLGAIFDRITAKIPELAGQAKAWGEAVGRTMTQLVDAFEQGRLGEVVEAALMAGVTRAGEEMIAAMIFAGNALYDTIAERMRGSDLGKMMNLPGVIGDTPIYDDLPGLMKAAPPSQLIRAIEAGMATKKHFSEQGGSVDTYQQTRAGLRDAFGSSGFAALLKDSLTPSGIHPSIPNHRYAQPNESTVFRDREGNRIVQVLESIDRRLAPQP